MSSKKEIIQEGGAGGHMMHPYDIDEFTFGQTKELIEDLFNCRIEHMTEKLDGQNAHFTISREGEVLLARKPSDLFGGGLTLNDIRSKWPEGSVQKDIFETAYFHCKELFDKAGIGPEFFNDGKYSFWANCEIMYGNHRNSMPYPGQPDLISVHKIRVIDTENNTEVNLPISDQKLAQLKQIFAATASSYGKTQVTPEVVMQHIDNAEKTINDFNSKLEKVMAMYGANDGTSFGEWRSQAIMSFINRGKFRVLFDNPELNSFAEILLKRFTLGEKKPTITQLTSQMKATLGKEKSAYYTGLIKELDEQLKKNATVFMRPLDLFFMRLGNRVIANCTGLANQGYEEQVIGQLRNSVEGVKQMLSDGAPEVVEKTGEVQAQLSRLAETGEEYNASEGVVFEYNGHTMKLTGSFAAINRLIGCGGVGHGEQGMPKGEVEAMLEESVRQMLSEVYHGPLYHFCSLRVFKNIVKENRFRLGYEKHRREPRFMSLTRQKSPEVGYSYDIFGMYNDKAYARIEFDSDKLLTIKNAHIDPFDYFTNEKHKSYQNIPDMDESRTKDPLSNRHRTSDESEESFSCGKEGSFDDPWKYINRIDIVMPNLIPEYPDTADLVDALRHDTMNKWEPLIHIYSSTSDMVSGKNEMKLPEVKRIYTSPVTQMKEKLRKRRFKPQHKLSGEEKQCYKNILYSKVALRLANRQSSGYLHNYFVMRYTAADSALVTLFRDWNERTYIDKLIKSKHNVLDKIKVPIEFVTYKYGDPMYSNPDFKKAYDNIVANMIDFYVTGNEMGWIEAEKSYPEIVKIVGEDEARAVWQNCDMIGENAARKLKF